MGSGEGGVRGPGGEEATVLPRRFDSYLCTSLLGTDALGTVFRALSLTEGSAGFVRLRIFDAPELTAVGGRALREMTRLGASPYSMWRDVAYTNTEAIAAAIHALEQRLAHLRENLRTPELRDEFELANRFRKG